MEINNMSGEGIFDGGSIPINVLKYEHHGNAEPHSHSFFEFVYIERGFSLHAYKNITTILTPGDLFVIKPGDVHGYTSTNNTSLYNCLFFPHALGNLFDEVMGLPGFRQLFDNNGPSMWKRIHLDLWTRSQATGYLDRMIWERANKNPGWELSLKSLLTSFLVLFSREYNNSYNTRDEEGNNYFKYVYNALSFIENNFKEDISVNDIASSAGVSADYLSRQFKQLTGITPIEYIKGFRFAKAIEMLKDPEVSVSKVCQEVGFDDQSYFAKQFKQMFGMSPSEYRRIEIK